MNIYIFKWGREKVWVRGRGEGGGKKAGEER